MTSPLLEADSIEKVFEVARHIGCAASGLTADARTLIEHARVECAVRGSPAAAKAARLRRVAQPLPRTYARWPGSLAAAEPPLHLRRAHEGGERHAGHLRPRSPLRRGRRRPLRSDHGPGLARQGQWRVVPELTVESPLVPAWCTVRQSRPFGVALLIAGVDENGPQLYGARWLRHGCTTPFRLTARATLCRRARTGTTPSRPAPLCATTPWPSGRAPRAPSPRCAPSTTRCVLRPGATRRPHQPEARV